MLKHKTNSRYLRATLFSTLLATAACDCGGRLDDKPGDMDAGMGMDAGQNPARDGGVYITTVCDNPPLQAPSSGTCSITAGDDFTLIRASIVVPSGRLDNGHLLISSSGKIACAACDCSGEAGFAGATVLECADAVVSPGLVNAHEHLNFAEGPPKLHPEERFDHRHDWRRGKNGHTRIPSPRNEGGNKGILWGELRHLMGGATTVNGSGGVAGLLRNLDRNEPLQEGLGNSSVQYSTFPLSDTSGSTRNGDCNYSNIDSPTESGIMNGAAYTPHISEGINEEARNEFLCLSRSDNGGEDVLLPKTSIIHAIGITPVDTLAIAAEQASVIWSPRSNIDLYGHTAQVTMMARYGITLALGTDWVVSGSMNMLREMRCADDLNRNNYSTFFSDRDIVDMATKNGAHALGAGRQLGQLKTGFEADVVIFARQSRDSYRAIIEAQAGDVVMVMRGGKALYGDEAVITALTGNGTGCEAIDVCGTSKSLCLQRDSGFQMSDLRAAIMDNPYEPFYCGLPPKEPSCVPFRSGEFLGLPTADDADGDGIINTLDLCPGVFSAIRALDGTMQADADGDMVGDVCDPCPLDANTTDCEGPKTDDRDGDGVVNDMDNCPDVANADQADADGDLKGDLCDDCPNQANPGNEACIVTVYEVKQAQKMGSVKITGLVVTATSERGYFAQIPADHANYDATLKEKFGGIFVFTGSVDSNPNPGDKVDIQGETTVFYGQIQIQNASHSVTAQAVALPNPVIETSANVGTGGSLSEEYEAVLVEVQNVNVTALNPEPGPGDNAPTNSYVLDGVLRVNDYMYLTEPFPVVSDQISFVRGILRHSNSHSKLEPRFMDDVGLTPSLRGFEPDLLFVPTATTGIPAGGFQINLSRATETQISIALVSSSTSVTVPNNVTIDAGSSYAEVPITVGLPTQAEEVVISASYDGKTVFAKIYPYDDNFARHAIAIRLTSSTIRPGASTSGEIELNLPAASMGSEVYLSVSPSNLGQVLTTSTATTASTSGDLELWVMSEQRLAMFTFVASSSTGVGMISARDISGTITASVSFEVTSSVTRTPMPGDLLITEILFNPSDSNEKLREWFEVYNQSADSIQIDGITIADNGGESRGFQIENTNLAIAPGGYAIFAYSNNLAENGGISAMVGYGSSGIQLSNSGDQITLIYQGNIIDEVTWTGSWPGGNGTAICLKAPYGDNDMSSSWSSSVGSFGSSPDNGHPGDASDSTNCP